MSSVTTSLINTANGTTSLGIQTGNTEGPRIVLNTSNQIILKANSTFNAVIANTTAATVNVPITANSISLGTPSLSTNGFVNLPNGTKMSWGSVNSSNNQTVTLPTTYSSAVYSIQLTPKGDVDRFWVSSSNTSTFQIRHYGTASVEFSYMVIGV
jgi:hypothetical protein